MALFSMLFISILLPFVSSDVDRTIVITGDEEQTYPDIYENILVWQEKNGVYWDIMGYDFVNGNEFTICDAANDQKYPKISGNYVVWEDYRNDASHSDIYGYDLTTNTEFAICTAELTQESPGVSGNLVAWSDQRNGGSGFFDIYVYNLTTSTEASVYSSSNVIFKTCIDGDKIAWEEQVSGDFVIKVYDISEDHVYTFTGSGGDQTEPDISGDVVVWNDRTYNDKIKGYDFSTSTNLDICADVNDHARFPCIDGNLVAWHDYRNDTIADIFGYDLATSTEFAIVEDPSSQGNPSISRSVVVWEDWRSGNDDIHYSRLGYDEWGPLATIDSVGPDPSNNSLTVTVNAVVSDARSGLADIAGAEYFIDTVSSPGTGTSMNPLDGTFDSINEDVTVDINVSAWSNGNYTVYIRGQDSDGNWGDTDSHQFYVFNDYSGPAASPVDVNPNPARCADNVTLIAIVNDTLSGGSIIEAAECSIDAEIVTHGTGVAMYAQDGAFDEPAETVEAVVDITSLDAGTHTFYFYGKDCMGNWSSTAGTYQFTVITDCTGPDCFSGSVSPDPANNQTSVTVTANTEDVSHGNSNIVAAEYFIGTAGNDGEGTAMAAADGTFNSPSESLTAQLDVTGWSTGTYTILVHAKDEYDNWGPTHSFTFDVSVDYDAPVVTDVDVDPDPARCAATVSVTATIDDFSTGAHPIVAAECSLDAEITTHGTGIEMQAHDGSFNTHSEQVDAQVNTSSLDTGEHTIYVYGQDSYGNWSDYGSYTFTYIADCTGPVTSGLALDPNPAPNNGFIELTGSVSDETTGGSAVYGAEYFIDTPGSNGTGTPMNAFSPPFSAIVEPVKVYIDGMALGTGTHTVYVHGKDQYDNWGSFSTISLEITTSGEIQLTDDDYGQYSCKIYDSLVVYHDDRYDISDVDEYWNTEIFLYNIATSQEVRITDNPMTQMNPLIHEDNIIWMDERGADYEIYGCNSGPDGAFGTADDVEFNLGTENQQQDTFAIYGDLIVWSHASDVSPWPYNLFGCYSGPDSAFGTADDVIFQLTDNASDQMAPEIYDGVIVWQDNINGAFDDDIHGCYPGIDNVFGTADDQFFIVDSNPADQTNPDVYGDNIVWQDARNAALGKYGSNWDIYGVNSGADGLFGTGDDISFQLTTDTAHQYNPKIDGSLIVWEDHRYPPQPSDAEICMYDLGDDGIFGTGDDTAEYQITRDGSRKSSPDVSTDYVVWSDSRDGYEIYAYQVGGGGGGSVSVESDPNSIVSDGATTSAISATVRDGENNLAPDGTQVAFSSTVGTLSASMATTTDGVATVTLTSSTTVETAEITASALGASDTTLVFFTSSATGIDSITQESVTNGTMDVKADAGTEVDVTGTAEVTVANYTSNPGAGFSGGSLDRYVDVYVPDTSLATSIQIRIYYSDDDVVGIDESTLTLDYWNGTSWVECSLTGVNTGENYVWATINASSNPSLTELNGTAFGGEGVKTFLDIDVSLLSDWNLISFSHIPTDTTLDTVLDAYGDVDYVYRWNSTTDSYEYSHYIDAEYGWQGDFSVFDRIHGFWMHCTSTPPSDLEVEGLPEDPEQIQILEGWNLVSWQKTTSESISGALGSIEQYIDYVYRWNPTTDSYEYSHYIDAEYGWQGDFGTIDPDMGYWFHSSQDCTWILS